MDQYQTYCSESSRGPNSSGWSYLTWDYFEGGQVVDPHPAKAVSNSCPKREGLWWTRIQLLWELSGGLSEQRLPYRCTTIWPGACFKQARQFLDGPSGAMKVLATFYLLGSIAFYMLLIVWLQPESRILCMYIMTSFSWMFTRVEVLMFVALNQKQVWHLHLGVTAWVYHTAQVVLLTFCYVFQMATWISVS